MKRILTLCPIVAGFGLAAQPTITSINMPQIGDVVTVGLCSDDVDDIILNASAGAGLTWDYSALTDTSEEDFNFVDPSTTLWASDFPNSNLCGVSWAGAHSYYIAGADALESEGNALIVAGPPPEDTAKFIFPTDHERLLELPFTYLDDNTDTFSGTLSAFGFTGTLDGTLDLDVDGYGTLILPNGTYTNVVRYHLDRVQNNTVLGNTTTQTKEQWAWLSEDHRFWLLLMEINFDGFNTSELVWYSKTPILAGPSSIAAIEDPSWGMSPLPVRSGGTVTLAGLSDLTGVVAEVLDATGRLLRTVPVSRGELHTDGLEQGVHWVRLTDGTGAPLGTGKLIVQ